MRRGWPRRLRIRIITGQHRGNNDEPSYTTSQVGFVTPAQLGHAAPVKWSSPHGGPGLIHRPRTTHNPQPYISQPRTTWGFWGHSPPPLMDAATEGRR
eukprot:7723822-Pyramimonas_sp.AAC.1